MGVSETVISGDGSVGFHGGVRGADELGHDMLRIDLPGRPRLYGEYKEKYAANNFDFDIEIISFGLTDPRNAGIPQPSRLRLSAKERIAVERLIHVLFSGPEGAQAREGMPAFSVARSTFLGGIHFLPGWVLEEGTPSVEVAP